jgi:hypothetical protein
MLLIESRRNINICRHEEENCGNGFFRASLGQPDPLLAKAELNPFRIFFFTRHWSAPQSTVRSTALNLRMASTAVKLIVSTPTTMTQNIRTDGWEKDSKRESQLLNSGQSRTCIVSFNRGRLAFSLGHVMQSARRLSGGTLPSTSPVKSSPEGVVKIEKCDTKTSSSPRWLRQPTFEWQPQRVKRLPLASPRVVSR